MIFTAPPHSGGPGPTTPTALQPRVHRGRTTSPRRVRRPGHRDPRLPGRRLAARPTRTTWGMRHERAMSAATTMQLHPVAARAGSRARGRAGAGRRRPGLGSRRPGRSPAAAETPPRSASSARRGAAGDASPIFDLTTRTGYISLPDGNTAFMWGYSTGSTPFQHPGPVLCVNEGDTVTVILHNTPRRRRPASDRLPRPGRRPRRRRAVAAAVSTAAGVLTSLHRAGRRRTAAPSPTASSRPPRHLPLRVGHQPREAGADGPVRRADRAARRMGADYAYDRADSAVQPRRGVHGPPVGDRPVPAPGGRAGQARST